MKMRPVQLQHTNIRTPNLLHSQVELNELKPDIIAERIVFWTIALVPLWWILGLQIAVYPLVGWYLFYRSLHRPVKVTLPFGWNMWWLYIGVWLLSLIVNLAMGVAEVGRSITSLGSIFGIWMLMVITWYTMRRLGIRYRVVVRAICVVGLCQLVAVAVGQTYLIVTGSVLQTHSLITTLVPSVPARIFFEAQLYGFDTLGWDIDPVPRLKSFYYWSPLAGTMSIFICMAAMTERQRFLQVLSFAGGLLTIWFAAARAAQVGVTVAILIAVWFGRGLGRKILLWSLLPLGLLSPIILSELYKYFFVYRSDSGAGRLSLYQETFQAFLNSPLIGYAVYGRAKTLDVPLGSHSQVYSTLYHTGVLGSCILIVAWLAITVALLLLINKRPNLSPTLGAWIGLSLQMPSGELSAASVTVFTLAAWLGCAWNYVDQMASRAARPWLPAAYLEPPTPWEHLQRWWNSAPHVRI